MITLTAFILYKILNLSYFFLYTVLFSNKTLFKPTSSSAFHFPRFPDFLITSHLTHKILYLRISPLRL